MTQHYLCLHSIRTQPSTRESCITSPPFPLFLPRRLVVSYLVIFHVFRSNLFFTISLSSARNLVYHDLPYPYSLFFILFLVAALLYIYL